MVTILPVTHRLYGLSDLCNLLRMQIVQPLLIWACMYCTTDITSALSGLSSTLTFAKFEPFALPPSLVRGTLQHPLLESLPAFRLVSTTPPLDINHISVSSVHQLACAIKDFRLYSEPIFRWSSNHSF